MSSSMHPMNRDSLFLPSCSKDGQDILLSGVFIHPDHLAQGFFADELASCSSSDDSSIMSFDEQESVPQVGTADVSMQGLTGLALTCDLGSGEEAEMHDYFSPRPCSANPCPFYSNSNYSEAFSSLDMNTSSPSSAATTPTCASMRSPSLSRRSSYASVYSSIDSPSLPATFSFSSFAPTTSSRSPPRVPSSPRSKPYSRRADSGTAMCRSISTPVETQKQLDARQRALASAEVTMDERTVKMARSRSVASSPPLGAFGFPCSGTASRSSIGRSGRLFSPLAQSFGEGWGAALPPRQVQQAEMINFPYTVAYPPVSPHRNTRANSYAGIENCYTPILPSSEHRASLPTSSLPFKSPDLASASASPSPSKQCRRRSRLMAFTPILPQYQEQVSSPKMGSCSMQAASAPTSPPRAPLHRGITF
ncbi:hypothetical protein JCM11641_008220 [Rhodosporidiobolus odoratus]